MLSELAFSRPHPSLSAGTASCTFPSLSPIWSHSHFLTPHSTVTHLLLLPLSSSTLALGLTGAASSSPSCLLGWLPSPHRGTNSTNHTCRAPEATSMLLPIRNMNGKQIHWCSPVLCPFGRSFSYSWKCSQNLVFICVSFCFKNKTTQPLILFHKEVPPLTSQYSSGMPWDLECLDCQASSNLFFPVSMGSGSSHNMQIKHQPDPKPATDVAMNIQCLAQIWFCDFAAVGAKRNGRLPTLEPSLKCGEPQIRATSTLSG